VACRQRKQNEPAFDRRMVENDNPACHHSLWSPKKPGYSKNEPGLFNLRADNLSAAQIGFFHVIVFAQLFSQAG